MASPRARARVSGPKPAPVPSLERVRGPIAYDVHRRRRRTVGITVRDDGRVEVHAPLRTSRKAIEEMRKAGGALLHVPVFMPGVGPALKLIGVAGAAAVLMRMHMALILEIGLLFGHDLDKPERLREIAAIIVASGLVAATPLLTRALNLTSYSALITGGLTVSTASQLIGLAALRYYRKRAAAKVAFPTPTGAVTVEA